MRSIKPLFRLTVGKLEFAPTLIPTIATLLLFPLLFALGLWQLHRAHEKEALQYFYQARAHTKPINFNQVCNITGEEIQYAPIQVTGTWDNVHQFLLDNKIYRHQVGYEVLTPLLINDEEAVLVNRGWIPRGANRGQLPKLAPITGTVTIQGIIQNPPKSVFVLTNKLENAIWPQRVQAIDFKQVALATNRTVPSFTVLLNSDQPNGFVREWSPADLKAGINYGYAIQWFSLAVALLIIFIVVNVRTVSTKKIK